MEAVFAANSVDEAAFPAVLDLLDLHAFDFAKVRAKPASSTPHAAPLYAFHLATRPPLATLLRPLTRSSRAS